METPIKYKAFISYSHADGRVGPRLHAWLESYRVPKPLVGRPGRTGPAPERLNPIFIDRAELPTSSNLSDVIVDALEQSEFLIVICSPNAARSRWVNEEVLTFRRLGRSDRVLCYIIGGEPNADDKPELGREECFPEAIRFEIDPDGQLTEHRTEPIAADQRREGDGTRRARIKLVAGLTGLSFGDLWPREEYRRRRSRNARLAVASTVLIAFALLSWATFSATQESRHQSQLAESNSESRLRTEYINQIGQANFELGRNNAATARELLTNCDPGLRSWEWQYLWRATDTSVAVLDNHLGEISDAALSPDGSRLVTVGIDSITIWDAVTGQVLRQLTDRMAFSADHVAFSPDGRRFATSKSVDKRLRLWDVASGSELTTFGDQPGFIMCIAYSPAGDYLASGDLGGNVAVWDIENGDRVALLTDHQETVSALAFSPDGRQLATAGFDAKIIIWDVSSMTAVLTLTGHAYKIHSLAFSPDGEKLASGASDDTVRVWDLATGATEATFRGHRGTVMALAFDQEGERLVSTGVDATVRVWSVNEKSAAAVLSGHTDTVESVAFDRPKDRIISASADGTVRYWDPGINARVTILDPPTGVPQAMTFAKSGELFAVVSEELSLSDTVSTEIDRIADTEILRETDSSFRTFARWKASTSSWLTTMWTFHGGRPIQAVSQQSAVVASFAHSPADDRYLTCQEKTIAIWREGDEKPTQWLKGHEGRVRWAEFSPDASRVASRDENGVVIVWNPNSGALQLKIDPADKNDVISAAFSPDASMIVVCHRNGLAQLWEIANQRLVQTFEDDTQYRAAAFSPDSQRVALGAADCAIHIFEVNGAEPVMTMQGHRGPVSSLAYLPDGSRIFSGSLDGTIKLWDVISGAEVLTLPCDRVAVNRIAISPDGLRLLAGGTEQTAKLYEATPFPSHALPPVGATAQVDDVGDANAEAVRLLTEAIGEIRLASSRPLLKEALIALTKAGETETARMAIRDDFDQIGAGTVLALLAKAQAEVGDIDGALEAAEHIPYELIRDMGYADIAEVCAEAGEISRAERVLEQIASPGSRNHALAAIASAYARESNYNRMEDALDAMLADEQLDWAIRGVVSTLSDLHETERAFAVADRIRETKARAYTQRTIVGDMARQGRIAEALATIDRIEDDAQVQIAWSAIAVAQAENGDYRRAEETLKRVTPGELYNSTLIAIAEEQIRRGDDTHAAATIGELPEEMRNAGRWRLARTHAELGHVESATELAQSLEASTNGIWSAIASSLAQRNDFPAAIEFFNRIDNEFDQADCAKEIATIWSASGDRAAVKNWVNDLNDPVVHAHGALGIALGALPPDLIPKPSY